ncbi:MAG: histidinol-phosphate transaminase [Clostridiales bacterium]|uniref:histidinol-phosphate transaminase n=1 Tax=Clostridium sp. N3C TaxID=1776758 RepID=UPI00092E02CA|nr:histidinol-phosphate transaminase [Clostridium sp. N3C]NLZ48144.1 histidinol-phosphate transaminase [Clostridiales bacterium]SCN22534.1 Histidinol-phosphate aminotransferase [Clostridium sp. N3C]
MGKLVINDKLNRIEPYVVDKREYRVKLDANESFLNFPESLKEELSEALMKVIYNRYPDPEAESLCRLYGQYCGVDSKYILAGNGSDEIIQTLMNGFLNCGDGVLTLKPDFSMYKFYASLIGAYVYDYALDENLTFDVEDFINVALNEDVKIIIFSTPNNPTGVVVSREDIIKIVEQTNALVVVDEAYYEFCGETVVDLVAKYENLAVLRTCSKAMGLAAARVGFIIAGELVINNYKKVKPPYNVNSLSQVAASVILKHPDIIKDNIQKIVKERDYLYEELCKLDQGNKFKVYPTSSNFIYIKSERGKEVYEVLRDQGIAIRCFGEYLRINAGSREENIRVLEAITCVLEDLK